MALPQLVPGDTLLDLFCVPSKPADASFWFFCRCYEDSDMTEAMKKHY